MFLSIFIRCVRYEREVCIRRSICFIAYSYLKCLIVCVFVGPVRCGTLSADPSLLTLNVGLCQWLNEVMVNYTAMTARHWMTVVAEELHSPFGRYDQMLAIVAPEPIWTTRHRREYVVRIHWAQNQMRSVPSDVTWLAVKRPIPTYGTERTGAQHESNAKRA